MKIIRVILAVLVTLAISLTSASCGESYKDAFIYIEFNSRPNTLDPQLVKTVEEMTVARSLFDTLLRYDSEGNIVSSGATSYTKDGNTYVFELDKDAKWHDGRAVTAHDYVFAFRRAVNPETKAPYAASLFSIDGAKEIYEGDKAISSLGVTAVDTYTLKIQLKSDDEDFLRVLTMPITMPCNEDYFYESKGKYGRTVDCTPSNGSYYVRVWTTESKFLIRLAKNLDYKGKFEANSMRIYYTCSDVDNVRLIGDENTDISYIDVSQYGDALSTGANITSTEDVSYLLLINDTVDLNVRKALLMSINPDFEDCELYETQKLAKNLFPAVLQQNKAYNTSKYISYDTETAQLLYSGYVRAGNKPDNLIVRYPNDSASESMAKYLAAHWQNKLSFFVNIESEPTSTIKSRFETENYSILIMPISATGGVLSSYLGDLGLGELTPSQAQKYLFENYYCYPLYFSTTNIAAVSNITNLENSVNNGIMDVSMLINK